MSSYLRMPRKGEREDTVYEVLGSGTRKIWSSALNRAIDVSVVWTRTVSGWGHVQNGRVRAWRRAELEGTDIYAISEEEAI